MSPDFFRSAESSKSAQSCPLCTQSAILIREYPVMKNSLTLKMKGKEGAKMLPTLRKLSVWKQKRKRRKRRRKVSMRARTRSPPSSVELCLACTFLLHYHVSFFPPPALDEKEEEKAKEEKAEPKGWALSRGMAIKWLCIYPCPQWDVAQLEGLEERRGSLDGFVTGS